MAATLISPAEADVKVGDYFYASWGYDQTNIDFFEVVGLTAKGVKVQHVETVAVEDEGGPTTYVVPGRKSRQEWDWDSADRDDNGRPLLVDEPVETKRLQTWGHDNRTGKPEVHLNWKSYATLHRWNGEPKYQTGAGWGH